MKNEATEDILKTPVQSFIEKIEEAIGNTKNVHGKAAYQSVITMLKEVGISSEKSFASWAHSVGGCDANAGVKPQQSFDKFYNQFTQPQLS